MLLLVIAIVKHIYVIFVLLRKIVNRIIKNVSQLYLINYIAEHRYQNRVKQYADRINSLSDVDLNIVRGISDNGVFVTSLDELQISHTEKLLNCCDRVLPELIASIPHSKQQFYVCNSSNKALEHQEIYLWGLDARLLNIVENYILLPAAYHGMYLRKDLANNVVRKSRLWHIDKEDRRMLKIIIYLNDVDRDGGCFQYIHRSHTKRIYQQLRYNHQYIKSDRIKNVVSESEWISCIGKAGTVIIVDTAAVFHRGTLPQTSDRLALFFDYSSSYPLRPYYCKPSFPVVDLLRLSTKLTSRSKNCVFWNQNLRLALTEFEKNFYAQSDFDS